MVRNEIQAVMTLADKLKVPRRRQDHAQDVIAKRVQTSRAGLTDRASRSACSCSSALRVANGTALRGRHPLRRFGRGLTTIKHVGVQDRHDGVGASPAQPRFGRYGKGGVLTEPSAASQTASFCSTKRKSRTSRAGTLLPGVRQGR